MRIALQVDALVTGANALAYLAITRWLGGVLGYPGGLLRGVGVFLLVYAGIVAMVSCARRIPTAGAWFAIGMNAAWTVASLACAVGPAVSVGASTIGRVWTVVQGLVVLAFAVAQLAGWRRAQGGRDRR